MTDVKFLELGRLNEPYLANFAPIAEQSFRSGIYIGGESVAYFEKSFAAYCGVDHCVSVGNGLEALVIALRALGVGKGDEVIVPGQTFIATWLAVTAVGAKIVPVDVDRLTANLDTQLIKAALTSRTRAIIPVHLYGAIADMGSILEIAEEYSLFVIEDAAQAHGALHNGKRAGSYGHFGCFSFYPSKNLGALGDAGALVTSDPNLAQKARLLANYGSIEKYVHLEAGTNSRMDPIQAAFLSLKLASLNDIIARRKTIASTYTNALNGGDSERISRLLKKDVDCVWHNFVVLVDDRKNFSDYMHENGVGTALHYPIIPSQQQCYSAEFGKINLPVSEGLAAKSVSLPIGEYLTAHEIEKVASAISSY
ncbi:DegT/DnrJ/EryC1/StrS family aminotransferase [Pararhizobium sp. DWP1-1-3]|uniref:DegT/DnrJ/EryC1/StrS family aminotransferase n=1 Tax=Pararhizobium sp. DWP1-1-3 TaxID=2804652 RepID=UPI003CEA1B95